MKNNWIVFFGSIAFFIVGAICIIILKLLFGEYYVDAVVALIMLTNVYFMIKNGIKKERLFEKEFERNGRHDRRRLFDTGHICIYNVDWLQRHKRVNIKVGE